MAESAPKIAPNAAIARSNLLREQGQAYEEAHNLRQEAIDKRAISPEVQQLNDDAHIALYGTGGKTEGFIDPSREVVGTYVDVDGNTQPKYKPLEAPVKGKLQEIRENRRYGTKAADRELAADKYEADVQHLISEGFELCQAKIIMDRWESRVEAAVSQEHDMNHKVTSLVNAGKTEAEARATVDRLMAKTKIDPRKEDKEFREIVKKDGIFTPDLERTYPGYEKPDDDPTKVMRKPEDVVKYGNLLTNYRSSRDEFARISAQRGRRSLKFGKNNEFSEEALIAARKKYDEAQLELTQHEVRMAKAAGISGPELDRVAGAAAAQTEFGLASAIYDHRQVATGRAKFNKDGSVSPVEPKGIFGKLSRNFEDWLGKANPVINIRGKEVEVKGAAATKKVVAMLGLGAVVGGATALTGGVLLAPILGGALGPAAVTGVTRSLLMSRASNRLNRNKRIDDLSDDLQQRIINRSNDPFENAMSAPVETQVSDQVKGNRKRLGKAAILGAAGAVGGDLIGHALGFNNLFGHGGGNGRTVVEQGRVGGGNGGNLPPIHPKTDHSGSNLNVDKIIKSASKPIKIPSVTLNDLQHPGGVASHIGANEYVSQVYEHAEGLHAGFNDMLHSAGEAHSQGLINIHTNPSDPSKFFYSVTSKGAEMFHVAPGSEDTEDVIKVLSGFGRLKS